MGNLLVLLFLAWVVNFVAKGLHENPPESIVDLLSIPALFLILDGISGNIFTGAIRWPFELLSGILF